VSVEKINISQTGFQSYNKYFRLKIEEYDLKSSLDTSFQFLDLLNKFADEREPWQTIKVDQVATREILYTLAE